MQHMYMHVLHVFWFVLLGCRKAGKLKKKKRLLWQNVKGYYKRNCRYFAPKLDLAELPEEGLPSQDPTFSHGMCGHLAGKEQANWEKKLVPSAFPAFVYLQHKDLSLW